MELAAGIMAAKQAQTLQTAQIKMIKADHDMQMSLINMIDQVARSAPPPGQGTQVDVSA